MPAKDIESEQMVIDNEKNVEHWPVICPDHFSALSIHELPNALGKHRGEIIEGLNRGVLQNLEPVVVDKLPVQRIQVCEQRDRQNADDDEPFLLTGPNGERRWRDVAR